MKTNLFWPGEDPRGASIGVRPALNPWRPHSGTAGRPQAARPQRTPVLSTSCSGAFVSTPPSAWRQPRVCATAGSGASPPRWRPQSTISVDRCTSPKRPWPSTTSISKYSPLISRTSTPRPYRPRPSRPRTCSTAFSCSPSDTTTGALTLSSTRPLPPPLRRRISNPPTTSPPMSTPRSARGSTSSIGRPPTISRRPSEARSSPEGGTLPKTRVRKGRTVDPPPPKPEIGDH